MKPDEFDLEFNRLVATYGKNHYPDERRKLIFREVSGLEKSDLARMIDGFIAECRQPPLVPEIREQTSRLRERLWEQSKRTRVVVNMDDYRCGTCHALGVVLARRKTDGAAFAFKCTCQAGHADRRAFPVWRVEHEREYDCV